jgi:fatty acid-binding protein DegV
VQLLHGKNPDAVAILREEMLKIYKCRWTPTVPVAPILGAHTGGSLVGVSIGAADLFKEVPGIVMS